MGRNQNKNRSSATTTLNIPIGQGYKEQKQQKKTNELNQHVYNQLDFKDEGDQRFTIINKAWEEEEAKMLKEIAELQYESDCMHQMEEGNMGGEQPYMLTNIENTAYENQQAWFVECDVCRYNVSPNSNESNDEKCQCVPHIANIAVNNLVPQSIIDSKGHTINCFVQQTTNVPIEFMA
jgi:hypothetical protein